MSYYPKVQVLDAEVKENIDYTFVELDGNQYISAATLIGPYDVKLVPGTPKKVSFTPKDGTPLEITVSNYSPGVDAFESFGLSVFKLSLLGLQAVANVDTLMITN